MDTYPKDIETGIKGLPVTKSGQIQVSKEIMMVMGYYPVNKIYIHEPILKQMKTWIINEVREKLFLAEESSPVNGEK